MSLMYEKIGGFFAGYLVIINVTVIHATKVLYSSMR